MNLIKKFGIVVVFLLFAIVVHPSNLDQGSVSVGLKINEIHHDSDVKKFVSGDIIHFSIWNVSGFSQTNDKKYKYSVDVEIQNEVGQPIILANRILQRERFLDKATLKQDGFTFNSSTLLPGKYVFSIKINDEVDKKSTSIQKEIQILDSFPEELTIENIDFGVWTNGWCVPKSSYTTKDEVCAMPFNVSNFAFDGENKSWFTYEKIIYDENGEIIVNEKNKWNDLGYKEFPDYILNSEQYTLGVGQELQNFTEGEYTFQTIIYDRIGKTQTSFNKTFSVKNFQSKNSLIIQSFMGEYDWGDCGLKSFTEFSEIDSICQEFFGNGFMEDNEGYIWFNAHHALYNSSNDKISDDMNLFRDTDQKTEFLDAYYVYQPLSNLEEGQYTSELTVVDQLSKQEAKFNKSFEIDETFIQDIPDMANFIDFYPNSISDELRISETKTYTVGFLDFETTLVSKESGGLVFDINGNETPPLIQGDIHEIFEGVAIGYDSQGSDEDGLWVIVYLGSE